MSQRGKCDGPLSLKLVAPMETPFAFSPAADSASPSALLYFTQQAIARPFARTSGLPPALLLVLTPIRKRLTSREFWLGAIVVACAIAALTIG